MALTMHVVLMACIDRLGPYRDKCGKHNYPQQFCEMTCFLIFLFFLGLPHGKNNCYVIAPDPKART